MIDLYTIFTYFLQPVTVTQLGQEIISVMEEPVNASVYSMPTVVSVTNVNEVSMASRAVVLVNAVEGLTTAMTAAGAVDVGTLLEVIIVKGEIGLAVIIYCKLVPRYLCL